MPITDDLAEAVGVTRPEAPTASLRIAPRQYTVELGAVERVEQYVAQLGDVSSVAVVGSESGYEAVRGDLEAAIERTGTEYEYRPFGGECSVSAVTRHRRELAGEPDLVVGVGGGKAIDTAKLVAEGVCPVVTVPTQAATSAAWAALSVVYDDDGLYRGGVPLAGCPDALLLDPAVVANSPARYLANGVMDASAKFFETGLIDENSVGPLAALGRSVAQEVYAEPLRKYAVPAIADARAGRVTSALEAASEAAIAGPGLAAGLLSDRTYLTLPHVFCYTSLAYGSVQSDSYHGERVAYGVLVLQALLGRRSPDLRALKGWYESLGQAMTLANLGIDDSEESIDALGRDVHGSLQHNLLPETLAPSAVIEAIETVEALPTADD